MGTRRMAGIPGFGIDRVATAVGEDPAVLRLENLDTDLRPAGGGAAGDADRRRRRRGQQLAALYGQD